MNAVKCIDCRNKQESGACFMRHADRAFWPDVSAERFCQWFIDKDVPIFLKKENQNSHWSDMPSDIDMK